MTTSPDQPPRPAQPPHPAVVIGIMVDQMRWDYLSRFRDSFGAGGFRRLMEEGFSCDNVNVGYSPSVTACGHTCVYTGSVPAFTGIIGNEWYDRYSRRRVYCTDDTTVEGVGNTRRGRMSPALLLTTTIGDEMGMADNFTSKVVGIALKDRAAILSAGHTATAAWWFDADARGFVTSTYYTKDLPDWVKTFDQRLSGVSDHDLRAMGATPAGSRLTLDFAKAAIVGYGLGRGTATDLLAISLSSPDGTGHLYGPYSAEIADTYHQLDKDLGDFFSWLDRRYGKDNYLLFLTADHGVAATPGYESDHRMPGGAVDLNGLVAVINDSLRLRFGVSGGIAAVAETQLYFDREAFERSGVPLAAAEEWVSALTPKLSGIAAILPQATLASEPLPQELKQRLINGYDVSRGGDMVILLRPGWKTGNPRGADHGSTYPYDTHIPLLWMGWKITPGATDRPIDMTDITPTLASLLRIQVPDGCIGTPIGEITRGIPVSSPRSSRPRRSPAPRNPSF